MSHYDWYVWLAAAVVAVVSVARTVRLLIWDEFPPAEWLRLKFFVLTGDSPWRKVGECGFCLAPYLAAGMVAWMWASDLHWSWWLVNGWWALSYLSAILVSYDQPSDGAD